MAIKTYNQPPFYDDFDETKNYLRMLFRPGYSVQARELTQLQTVLQNQISRFGSHVFNDGSKIAGGDATYNNELAYVKIDSTFGLLNVDNYYDEFVGTTITGQTSGVKATVTNVEAVTSNDPITLFVKYTSVGTDGITKTFQPEETIRSDATVVREASVLPLSENPTGTGSKYSILESIYFVNGGFVYTPAQEVIISKYSSLPSARIVFRVDEQVVTSATDVTLNDNALGSPNESAPGAHRYAVTLTLAVEDYDFASRDLENYIQLAVIKDGVIIEETNTTTYNEILDLLATRTYEESGNYTVRPFQISMRDHVDGDANKLSAVIEPSVAYVNGYRIETIAPTYVDVDRSRDPVKDIQTFEDSSAYMSYGNYVTVNIQNGLPDVNTYEEIDLLNASNGTIGTARARSLEIIAPNVYRVYLFDIKMTGNRADIAKLTQDGTPGFDATLITTGLIEDAGNNVAIFPHPYDGVKSTTSATITTKRIWSAQVSGNVATFLTGSENELFSDFQSGIMAAADGTIIDLSSCTLTPGGTTLGQQLTVSGAPITAINGQFVYFIVSTFKRLDKAQPKNKVIVQDHGITIANPNTTGGGYDLLDVCDIYQVKAIYMSPSLSDSPTTSHQDVTDRYDLDNGQRDNFYDVGRIRLKNGKISPSGQLLVVVDYFEHGAGDFFTVDSYAGQVDWKDIPSYTSSKGTYNLRNVVDCRPRKDTTGSGFTGEGTQTLFFPENNSLFVNDLEVYLSRRDKIYLKSDGTFQTIRGTSSLTPQYPQDPENSMTLFELEVQPYTGSPSDVNINFIDNKRYTMRDIGKIEQRVDNLEYYTTLSLLEKDVMSSSTLANDGTERFRNGFIVDGFYGHNAGDVFNADYKVSMDFKNGILRPHFYQDAVDLEVASTSGTQQHATLVTLPISEHAVAIEQPYASTFENLNPYLIFKYDTNLQLSPDSDTWFDVDRRPEVVLDLTGMYDAIKFLADETGVTGTEWNSWETQWSTSSRSGNTITTRTGQTATGVNTSIAGQTVSQSLGDRVVDINVVPFIRSRRVWFYAGRMKPNTKLNMFFDGELINDYARSEMSDFATFADWEASRGTTETFRDQYYHPNNSNQLVTNEDGEIWGSFIVPSNANLQFRTGQRVIRLTDSSTNNMAEAETTAEGIYTAQGFVKAVEGTTVNTKIPQFETTEVSRSRVITSRVRVRNRDPLAQTFVINDEGGAFITKFDLYFKTVSETSPVTLQIRTVDNGYPTKVVLAEKTIAASDMQNKASADATVATTFTFDDPLFLNDQVEYAFVLKANDTDYNIWVSELGQFDVTNQSLRIAKQPESGVLFKSANDSTWTAEQFKDIKYTIYRAEFDTSAQGLVTLHNNVIPSKRLGKDPFTTYDNSNDVRVEHPNHGLFEGSKVTFSGVTEADSEINGIDVSYFNTQHTVSDVEADSYVITLSVPADANGTGGGSAVMATENKKIDTLKTNIQEIVLPDTEINWTSKMSSGQNLGNNTNPYVLDISEKAMLSNSNITLKSPKVIASPDNENPAYKSFFMYGTLSSTKSNLSPVIDSTRMSVICVTNKIDNPVAPANYSVGLNNVIADDPNGQVRFVAETESKDNSALSRYITRKITLEEDANDLKMWIKVSRPSGTYVDVYYRLQEDDTVRLEDTNWTLFTPTREIPLNDDESTYAEVEYDAEDIGTFSNFQVKVVLRSNNSTRVPQLRDLRIVALS